MRSWMHLEIDAGVEGMLLDAMWQVLRSEDLNTCVNDFIIEIKGGDSV